MFFIENTSSLRLVNLVWGLADGWWNFEDDAIRTVTPLMPAQAWRDLLASMNFSFAGTYPVQEENVFNDHELIMIRTAEENPQFIEHLATRYAPEIQEIKTGIQFLQKLPGAELIPAEPGTHLNELLSVIKQDCGVVHEVVCLFENQDALHDIELFAEKNGVEQCVVFSPVNTHTTVNYQWTF